MARLVLASASEKVPGASLEPGLRASPSLTQPGPGEATCMRHTRAFQDVIVENSDAIQRAMQDTFVISNILAAMLKKKKRRNRQNSFD